MLFDDIAEVCPGPVPGRSRARNCDGSGPPAPLHAAFRGALQDFFAQMEAGPSRRHRVRSGLFEQFGTPPADGTGNDGAMSDVGLVGPEDNWVGFGRGVDLYVCADGMGHDKGEVASQMAVDTICREAVRVWPGWTRSAEALENLLEEKLQRGSNAIKEHSEQLRNDMGTTMVASGVEQASGVCRECR